MIGRTINKNAEVDQNKMGDFENQNGRGRERNKASGEKV